MHLYWYEIRLYKSWYFHDNACAVMFGEPRMLQDSCGILCVWDCARMQPENWIMCLCFS